MRIVSSITAFLLLLLCGQTVCAQELKPWKHGVIEPKGDAGFMWMVGKHDFAAKHGLKLEIIGLKNGALAHRALLAGELDGVESSPGGAIIAGAHGADRDRRLRLARRAARIDGPRRHRQGRRPQGRDGRGCAPGSLPNLLLKAMLEQNQVPESDVKVASLGGDLDRFKAVIAGVVDAGIVAAEFLAVAPKDVRMLVRGRDALPNYVRFCLTITGKTLSARREDAVNFVAAQMDALRYTDSHRDDTIAVTRAETGAKPDDPKPAFAYDDTVTHGAIDPAVALPLDKFKWMSDALVKAGNLKTPVDLAKITDVSIRDEAAKRAGK